MTGSEEVILDSFASGAFGRSYRFSGLLKTISATTVEEVLPALRLVENESAAGYHAAGFIAYEAAAAINPLLTTKGCTTLPLVWFGIFSERTAIEHSDLPTAAVDGAYTVGRLRSSTAAPTYKNRVRTIRDHIAAGDTYQVNYTFRRRFRFSGDPMAFYHDLCRSQQAPFCAYLTFGRFRLLSTSPELFFALKENRITVCPMKGTARRGRTSAEDQLMAERLKNSPKERAENLMIVDLLRNDLGIIAETGSVKVTSLFDVSRLPTVHQLSSTITATLPPELSLIGILAALFPCGSVTGAPKRKTMELIAKLEDSPRGAYTGCIGFISPGKEAAFSVAIRTVLLDLAKGVGEIGLGSGITSDSSPAAEYAECRAKGIFLTARMPDFQLIETLLHTADDGLFLLDRHLARLAASAAYFGFRCDQHEIRQLLAAAAAKAARPAKMRLLLSRNGAVAIESESIKELLQPHTVRISSKRVNSGDPFLYHKTTYRPLYRAELQNHPECSDLLFCNERGEVTEAANCNIVARIDGKLLTPPVASGLLAGTFRDNLLESGTIVEQVLYPADLAAATELFLINSVRRWRKAVLASGNETEPSLK